MITPEQLMPPLLKALANLGGSARIAEIDEEAVKAKIQGHDGNSPRDTGSRAHHTQPARQVGAVLRHAASRRCRPRNTDKRLEVFFKALPVLNPW